MFVCVNVSHPNKNCLTVGTRDFLTHSVFLQLKKEDKIVMVRVFWGDFEENIMFLGFLRIGYYVCAIAFILVL